MVPAIFFDRDGVLNADHGYVASRDRLEWVPGAFDAVRLAQRLGYLTVVITNQSGIARGFFSEAQFRTFTAEYLLEFTAAGCALDGLFYCPDLHETRRRKPAPGMLFEAANVLNIDLQNSLFVGDKESDMEAATSAGVTGVLFSGGNLEQFLRLKLPAVTVG